MIDFAPAIARLAAEASIAAGGLQALAELKVRPLQHYPAYFVAPDRERGEATFAISGIHDQWVTANFIVAIYLDMNSASVGAQLEGDTAAIEAALVGWAHPQAGGEATSFVGGQLVEIEGGRLAYFLTFQTRRRIRCNVTT